MGGRSDTPPDGRLIADGSWPQSWIASRDGGPRRPPPTATREDGVGKGLTDAVPGSVQGMQLVVADIEAARADLTERGLDLGEVQHFPWGSFVYFQDPDGNGWAVQGITI